MADASLGRRPPDDHEGLFHGLRNWLRQLTRSRNGETSSLREELEELIEEHKEEQPIDPHERTLLTNILKLHELNAADIMVPRVDIIAIEVDTPFDEAVKQIVEQGHSRVPLYRETHDDADQPKLIERPDGSLIADARTRIAALQERVPAPLLSPEQEEGIATLGGLVGALAGRVPARGEVFKHSSGLEFEVLDADPRRIKRVRVRGLPPATADANV